jgi:hypothetical protein
MRRGRLPSGNGPGPRVPVLPVIPVPRGKKGLPFRPPIRQGIRFRSWRENKGLPAFPISVISRGWILPLVSWAAFYKNVRFSPTARTMDCRGSGDPPMSFDPGASSCGSSCRLTCRLSTTGPLDRSLPNETRGCRINTCPVCDHRAASRLSTGGPRFPLRAGAGLANEDSGSSTAGL